MNESVEKIEPVKDNRLSEQQETKRKQFNEDSPDAIVDKTPYRGYGFSEVFYKLKKLKEFF